MQTGDPEYALEKLSVAVGCLATGPGDARSRLAAAYKIIMPLTDNDFPEDLRGSFRALKDRLTCDEPRWPGEGRLDASLARMKNSTGTKLATTIVDLHDRLENLLDDEKHRRDFSGNSDFRYGS